MILFILVPRKTFVNIQNTYKFTIDIQKTPENLKMGSQTHVKSILKKLIGAVVK